MNLRLLGAAAVLVSAAVHLVMWFDGVRDQHVIGPAFMLNAFGGLVIAVLLVAPPDRWPARWPGGTSGRSPRWLPALLTLGFGLSTLGAFTVASTVGLFGVHTHWSGGYVWTATVSEVVAIVVGAVLLSRDAPLRTRSSGLSQHRLTLGRPHLH